MPQPNKTMLSDSAIQQINSLGGAPLPTGISAKTLKVILENRCAAETQLSNYSSISDYDHSTGAFDNDGFAGPSDPDNRIPVRLLPAESDDDNDFIKSRFGI